MSIEDQDKEIGRQIREHRDRRREYVALTGKLKRIGAAFQQAAGDLNKADADSYSESTQNAKTQIEMLQTEVDLSDLVRLLNEHVHLTKQLVDDQRILKEYGVEK